MSCLLVVVRSLDDLDRNLETIAQIAGRLGGPSGQLMGVLCDAAALAAPPSDLAVRLGEMPQRLAFRHSFECAGLWAVWSFEPADGAQATPPVPDLPVLEGGQNTFVPVSCTDRPRQGPAAAIQRLAAALPRRPSWIHADA